MRTTDRPDLGILGDAGVNVLMLNLALDAKYPMPAAPSTQTGARQVRLRRAAGNGARRRPRGPTLSCHH